MHDYYSVEELVSVVSRSAKILEITMEEEGAWEISRRSRGTPRVANRLLRRVRDYAEVKSDGKVTAVVAHEALNMQGVDEKGLDILDRKVLNTVMEFYDGGPVGIEALAASLNEETDTIVDIVEPFLLKIGFLKRTSRGREATRLAYEHFKKVPPKKEPQKEMF